MTSARFNSSSIKSLFKIKKDERTLRKSENSDYSQQLTKSILQTNFVEQNVCSEKETQKNKEAAMAKLHNEIENPGINISSSNWNDYFLNACQEGHIEMVEFIVDYCVHFSSQKNAVPKEEKEEDNRGSGGVSRLKKEEKIEKNYDFIDSDWVIIDHEEPIPFQYLNMDEIMIADYAPKSPVTNSAESSESMHEEKVSSVMNEDMPHLDWNLGLANACSGEHIEIAKFMIEKGAHKCCGVEDCILYKITYT